VHWDKRGGRIVNAAASVPYDDLTNRHFRRDQVRWQPYSFANNSWLVVVEHGPAITDQPPYVADAAVLPLDVFTPRHRVIMRAIVNTPGRACRATLPLAISAAAFVAWPPVAKRRPRCRAKVVGWAGDASV